MSNFQHTPEQQPIIAAITRALNDGVRGVYLHGASGTGKTFIANQVAKYWNAKFIINALDAVYEAQSAMSDRTLKSVYHMRQNAKESDVVVLDDMGAERKGYGQDVMFALLDAALQGHAFVIVTSNEPPKELVAMYAGDERFASRLSSLTPIMFPHTMPNLRKAGRIPVVKAVEPAEQHGPPITDEQRRALHDKLSFRLRGTE